MAVSRPRTTFLSLPVELRLQIAEYALEQTAHAGISARLYTEAYQELEDVTYRAADNLSILLVCRQFYQDFAQLAFHMTTFVLNHDKSLPAQVTTGASSLRKIVVGQNGWSAAMQWGCYPFDDENMYLDELSFIARDLDLPLLTKLLRRLKHVKSLRIYPIVLRPSAWEVLYCAMLGAMYKEDHYQRYDAPDAPNVGQIWFEPHFDEVEMSFEFKAQDPAPMMAEEGYLTMMKPKIEAIMMRDRFSGIVSEFRMIEVAVKR